MHAYKAHYMGGRHIATYAGRSQVESRHNVAPGGREVVEVVTGGFKIFLYTYA